MAIPGEASDAFFLEKRKKFLAAAGMLYAPVCTPLSRHLLNDFARLSRAPVDTAICSKCNCLFLGDSSRVIIGEKPALSQRIRCLRRKSNSQLTGLERRKLRRWENRKSKVVIYCKTCKQTVSVPGPPSAATKNIHRKKAFTRQSGTPKSSLNTKWKQKQHHVNSTRGDKHKLFSTQTKRDKDKLDVNPANRGKNERKLKHIKSMLKGNKKKSDDSKSPLLKFLSSL